MQVGGNTDYESVLATSTTLTAETATVVDRIALPTAWAFVG